MKRIFSQVSESRADLFARIALAVMLVWFGSMNFTSVGAGNISGWLDSHMFLSMFGDQAGLLAMILGVFQIVFGLLLIAGKGPVRTLAALGVAFFSLMALTLIIFANVWVDSMGGFPVIGKGQGIIKYVSILGVALFIAAQTSKQKQRALVTTLVGIVLVMGWIGGMKFTALEANGIKPLLETSPLFSWLLNVFSLQGASNLIGVFEIVAAVTLTGWFFNRTVFLIGASMCVITFFGTLSFMVTFPATWAADLGGFPALGGSGHFLLKDLVMLAGTFLLIAHPKH